MPVVSVEDFVETSFDYLILGGGTAGCVLAGRLSENPNIVVGLIEAGKHRPNDPLIDTPGFVHQLFENPEYDWCFYTAPQTSNLNKKHHMPRGKVLGGSSAINGMMYVRPSLSDFDSWADLVGDSSWGSKVMMHYMKKHETADSIGPAVIQRPTVGYDPKCHGTDGPIQTSFNNDVLETETSIIKACYDLLPGDPPNDAWSGSHLGFFNTLGTVGRSGPRKGKRCYAVEYLNLDRPRPNLKILCEAMVTRINLEGTRAQGASFIVGGHQYNISAAKEVILCAGAVQSPQVLEVSGIGHPDILKVAGVECKVENRGIGANFQDHCFTTMVQHVQPGIFTLDSIAQQPAVLQKAVEQYSQDASGPLGDMLGMQGFLPLKRIVTDEELNAIVKSVQSVQPTSDFHQRQLDEVVKQLRSDTSANLQIIGSMVTWDLENGAEHQSRLGLPPPADKQGNMSMLICHQYPVARGSVHITSPDINVKPAIDPACGGHEADRTILAAGLRWLEKVAENKHLAGSLGERSWPPKSEDLQDINACLKAVERVILGEFHACGSVAMGDALDSRLRVKGVQALRVVDASIFPNNVSGNILSTVYALAEKAADMVKEDMK